ncbi:MAG: NAD-glutamate dehydrogenase, partial [Deltaproteobacteria bacterium]|nr:NAD-glutamate dehydrogenase [Deltaproteobacteria bacterium]
ARAVAARLRSHFAFIAREMPPAYQLYKGLPGIHVRASNPGEREARGIGGGTSGLPIETTVVETHTADVPFIFESLKNYFQKAGVRVFVAIHPIITVQRQWERVVAVSGPRAEGARESYCHFQIEQVESSERLRRIEHEIFSVLKGLFCAVEDFKQMLDRVRDLEPRLRSRTGNDAEVASAREFLQWLVADNYVFQGVARYQISAGGRADRIDQAATGVFTDPALLPVVFPGLMEAVEPHLVPAPDDGRIVEIDYCRNASAIYHLEPLDDIVVREWSPEGRLAAATLIVGRFSKGAFNRQAAEIPLLREKRAFIMKETGAMPESHLYRQIRAIFNRLPQRELFYAPASSVVELVEKIAAVTSDDEIVVHVRRATGYTALAVAFSRLRYSYRVEQDLRSAFANAFGAIPFSTSEDCGAVKLLLFYFEDTHLEHPVESDAVRALVTRLLTTWEDRAAAALEKAFGEREGRRLLRRYARPESRNGLYRESTAPETVADDVRCFEAMEASLEMRVQPRTAESMTLHVYSQRALTLTDTLRTLGNLGLTVTEELRVPVVLPEGRRAFIYRFEIEAPPDLVAATISHQELFATALRALDEEAATDDSLNALVLMAGLSWREVEVLRTLRNHLLQLRSHYNAETVGAVLLKNSAAAGALYRQFAARLDPALAGDRAAAVAQAEVAFREALESVTSLAEDEVLRALDDLIRATLRTNFFQNPQRPVVSIKVDSRKVESMPSPRPMVEIYVHSRLLEGVHLRGGKVARGGIRWSDRHDDFRTEILGLMKTQMVKNSVIVPVGSKGGFVLKGNVPARPALDAYLVDRYREFVAGLLDVTDNIVAGKVIHPPEVVRCDGDDPYLVVAADKGTAHLSDTANAVSNRYGFWLGDAFASGGSAGYDHKKMGITARGAWECVKHHFDNLGVDVQREPFTAVGIGDMSGDVFGNGVLLSPVMRLQAAFNHAHIFIDPDPDVEASSQERRRLFELPRSTWRDYDATRISAGGGIFERSAKAIPISAQMRKLLDIEADSASGEEVIRRILTAKVDLLYNGGIGTYVKAAGESDAEVGDRTNDRVRVSGRQLRCRVVGEGGNLGLTQRGRLEYWERGGLINTDAVDNSGGVDTSDHEVNIKILMDMLVRKGVLAGRDERNAILAEMTDQVRDLVLADNRHQALCLSLDGLRSVERYEEFVQLVEDMIGAGILDRGDDAIPAKEELLASTERGHGLPRPLLCVLLGHCKNRASQMLIETAFPDHPLARPFLDGYFPARLRDGYAGHFTDHALRREIIATSAVNSLINGAGIAFLPRTMAATKADIGRVVAAYFEAQREAGAGDRRAPDTGGDAPTRQQALLEMEAALESAVLGKLAR